MDLPSSPDFDSMFGDPPVEDAGGRSTVVVYDMDLYDQAGDIDAMIGQARQRVCELRQSGQNAEADQFQQQLDELQGSTGDESKMRSAMQKLNDRMLLLLEKVW